MSEASDLSFLTDSDLEEQRAAVRSQLAQPVAALQLAEKEVDRDELERIALSVARHAVPPAPAGEDAEAVVRLGAASAGLEQAEAQDSIDPLGLGRIDMQMLLLLRMDAAPAKQRYSSRASALDASHRGAMAGRGGGAGAGAGAGDGGGGRYSEAPLTLRSKVLPGSEQFDAELYLGTLHTGTGLPELLRGLHSLQEQLSEHTGQLKLLVKENFERFISSKNTIDTIYTKLQKAEAEGGAGVHGASTNDVMDAVVQVQDEAQRTFGSLLGRQAKGDRIRLELAAVERYDIVQLPSRVHQHAEAGDYEQVVAVYRRAKALLADQKAPAGSPSTALDRNLMSEIDKVADSVAHTLETCIRSPHSDPSEAANAIKSLLQFQSAGVAAAQKMDPIGLYVDSQEKHVKAMLEAYLQQHAAELEAVQSTHGAPPEAGPTPITAAPAAAGMPPDGNNVQAAAEAAVVRYVSTITSAFCQWLGLWWLMQQQLAAVSTIGEDAAAAVERGAAASQRSLLRLLALYHAAVHAELCSRSLSHAAMLDIARLLAAGCQALEADALGSASNAYPAAALECMQGLVGQSLHASLAQAAAHLAAAVGQLCSTQDWQLATGLQQLVLRGMHHLQSVLGVASQASIAPLKSAAAPAAELLLGCFSAFAAGMEAAAPGLLPRHNHLGAATQAADGGQGLQARATEMAAVAPATPAGGRRDVAACSPQRRLLVLCASLSTARNRLLPQQLTQWAPLLQAACGIKDLRGAARVCEARLEAVETWLAGSYIEQTQALLDEVMEQLLFADGTAWSMALPPVGLRPLALDLAHTLAAIQAELAAELPVFLHEILEELLLGTVDGFAQVLSQGALSTSPGGALQLWLEGRFVLAVAAGRGARPLQQACTRLQAALDQRLETALAAATSSEAARIDAWAGAGRGQSRTDACKQRLEEQVAASLLLRNVVIPA